MHTSTYPCIHESMNPCIHASMHACIRASVHPSIPPSSIHPFIHSSIHPSIHPSINPSIHPSSFWGAGLASGESLFLVIQLVLRVFFFSGYSGFPPSPQKPTFPDSNRPGMHVERTRIYEFLKTISRSVGKYITVLPFLPSIYFV